MLPESIVFDARVFAAQMDLRLGRGERELAADLQQRIANGIGLQTAAVHAPEQAIGGIDLIRGLACARR
jgi:hypothetical protein